jgi:murein DD-endopeptidase MepM/ murein hydrolase activator NlpD
MNTRLSKIFGVKILPVAGKVTSTAKEMLDTEMEYIEYLRNRRKFFFMTQVQQTRVSVRGKSQKEEEKKKKKSRGGGVLNTVNKLRKIKKALGNKKLNKKTKLGRFRRNLRAGGLKLNRKVQRSPFGRAKKFVGGIGKKIGGKVKGVKKAALDKVVTAPAALKKNISNLIPKSAKKKVAQKLVKTATKKGLQKAGAKVGAKLAAKTAVKIGLKKIPVIGLIAGLGFGAQRLLAGDVQGALMEAGSGIASTIPGPGTAISAGIDAALIAKDVTGMKDGGEVSSPTQALIAEGGEPELVVPHSKLGPVFRSLLSNVGNILTDVTTGFLSTLPVPTSESSRILGETAKIAAVFGQKGKPISVFKGGKIAKLAGGFLKKMAGGAMGLAKGAFGMTPIGMAMGMLSRPARADGKKLKFRKRTVKNTISDVNGVMTSSSWDSDTATSIANFPITDKYGSTEGRSRPHGGVDIGTPVGTPVGFTEPGEILAAGEYGGYGNMMDVWLPAAKIQMRIAHLSKFVKKTGEFMAGEKLAETGGAVGDPGSGSSTGPHLHFEADNKKDSTRYGGAGDPLPYAPLINLSAVEPPSGGATGKGGASYGFPLTNTIKWPTSGGSMGGPGLLSGIGNMVGSILGGKTKIEYVPFPVPVVKPFPVPVTKIVTVTEKDVKAYGIDPFSGKYGVLNG